jgi:hypothetical protein
MHILETGEKILVIERRYFKEDLRRHFIGEVVRCTDTGVRVKGHVWACEAMKGFIRKPEDREIIITFDKGLTINIIPPDVNLEDIKYTSSLQKGHFITDGRKFSLDITEFVPG